MMCWPFSCPEEERRVEAVCSWADISSSFKYVLLYTTLHYYTKIHVAKPVWQNSTCLLKPSPFAYYTWLVPQNVCSFCLTEFSQSKMFKRETRAGRLGQHLPSRCRSLAELSDLISSTALITQQMGTERSVTKTKTSPRLDYGSCGVRVCVQSDWALFWLSVQKQIVLDCWVHRPGSASSRPPMLSCLSFSA